MQIYTEIFTKIAPKVAKNALRSVLAQVYVKLGSTSMTEPQFYKARHLYFHSEIESEKIKVK